MNTQVSKDEFSIKDTKQNINTNRDTAINDNSLRYLHDQHLQAAGFKLKQA